ncbi:alpha/beta-Hydrolases superfamily protein [Perilla frutescens var. hirtella]|uniref:Alpha/beta-Hydrolases superfamily protein n=1 Tax=Perilla frutescens var. hirtella TaxID=608512 RepID=A0AAD4JLN1_PERFH|nr:alpha/beta-Hydrolases superfamily protein [Perilla frutescens var. hirtella]
MGHSLLEALNVRVVGSGEKIMVLAHGFGTDQSAWQRILPFFRHDHRIVLFDLVCAGTVNPDYFDFRRYTTLDAYVDDLLYILDALRIDRCTYVGHSVSATIGILAAIKRPDIFTKLILIGFTPRVLNDHNYHGGFEVGEIEQVFSAMEANYEAWVQGFAPLAVGADVPEARPERGVGVGEGAVLHYPDGEGRVGAGVSGDVREEPPRGAEHDTLILTRTIIEDTGHGVQFKDATNSCDEIETSTEDLNPELQLRGPVTRLRAKKLQGYFQCYVQKKLEDGAESRQHNSVWVNQAIEDCSIGAFRILVDPGFVSVQGQPLQPEGAARQPAAAQPPEVARQPEIHAAEPARANARAPQAQCHQPEVQFNDPYEYDAEEAFGDFAEEFEAEYDPFQRRERPRQPYYRHAARRADLNSLLNNIKTSIPEFEGLHDPDLYLDSERKVDKIFDCYDFSE